MKEIERIFEFDTKRILSSQIEQEEIVEEKAETGLVCSTCNFQCDREHFKTDWHRYNLKRKLKSMNAISESEFDELAEISSIESDDEEDEEQQPKIGSPFVHFELDNNQELLVYKQLLSNKRDADWKLQLDRLKPGKWCILLLASGHFAGAVIDSNGNPIVQKAFHRYTTRRKQGGAQSSNDKSKGHAYSAGAGIRRYNEQALREEIQELLWNWKQHLQECSVIFVRTPVPMRKTIFYDDQVLDPGSDKVRSIPFITKRPTIDEVLRCYSELVKLRIQQKVKVENSGTSAKVTDTKAVDDSFLLLLEAVKKGKLDTLKELLRPDFVNHTISATLGTSLLHVASQYSHNEMIKYLLENGADPTLKNNKNSTPYDVAGSKESRDVFRRYMHHSPTQWDYASANIPGPLTPEMEERKKQKEQEKKRREKEKKKEKKQEKKDQAELLESVAVEEIAQQSEKISKKVGVLQLNNSDKQTLGMTPEQKQRFEREKRY